MIIYNVTIKIEHDVQEDWLEWMKSKHIPDVMNTNLFKEYRICKLIGQDDDEGVSYAIQYFCESLALLQKYQGQHAPALQREHTERYKDKFVAFRTIMEMID